MSGTRTTPLRFAGMTSGGGGFAGMTSGAGGAAGSFDGGFGGAGGAGDGGGPQGNALGKWAFNDCNPFRTELFDSAFGNHTAFRSVGVECIEGVSNLAVGLAGKEDVVYVPDQPIFTFEQGLTVAAWYKPRALKGVQTLFRKRDQGTSSFALVLNGKSYQLVINLGRGRAASVAAPARAGVTTHVAGTYDGAVLRLYVDGVEAASARVRGTIENGEGPVLMGNDGSLRNFEGMIDTAFFDRRAATAAEIASMNCKRANPTIVATPATSAPTPPGTPASYDVTITNNSNRFCQPDDYFFSAGGPEGVDVQPGFDFVPAVPSGGSARVTVTATGAEDTEPGTYSIGLQAFAQSKMGDDFPRSAFTSVDFVLTAGSGCRVSTARELMIRNVGVVDDPIRTDATLSPASDPRAGAWTFKRLVERMAPTPEEAPAMVEELLTSFTVPTTVNGFTVDPRPGMVPLVLGPWPRTPSGALDLSRAPLRLLAIVNRFDLRNLANGDAGEGRLVFGVLGPGGFPLQFTMIFEYKLPASTPDDVRAWAEAWHALGALPVPSEAYNAALQVITDRFTARGARPGRPNGNAINAVRTNEIDLHGGIWQLREFALSPSTGRLVPATVKLTPDNRFNVSPVLADFINQNEASILTETHDVPESFQGAPFLGGAVFNDLGSWTVPGVTNPEARHKFALNTCNGCHSSRETGVFFLQVSPRDVGQEAFLSGFLTGTSVFDPQTGQLRTFNDLARRSADFRFVVCPGAPPPPPPPGPGPIPPPRGDGGVGGQGGSTGGGGVSGGTGGGFMTPSLTKGIDRVH